MNAVHLRQYADAALKALTLGREEQSFLGARWIPVLLRRAPSLGKRRLALSVLSWSPHYFYRRPEYQYHGLSHSEFTEREFERNRITREKLARLVLGPHLDTSHAVLDYGCGAGFLVHHVSGVARTVYGVDVSQGVLECARVLNAMPNARFIHTSNMGDIADATIDLAYSIAVAQHITDSLLQQILETLRLKLKPHGKLLLHVVLDADGWRREETWREDSSLSGRLKLQYGLNCFSRSEPQIRQMLEAAGFGAIVIRPMSDFCPDPFDDVCTQHLVCARAADTTSL
jgi:SAM-dependent methyltransferase